MLFQNLRNMGIDLWVFDNDGTLYQNPKNLELAVEEKMIEYIANFYHISKETAKEKRKQLFQNYNTKYTLIALRQEGITEDDFIQKTYLAIDPADFGIKATSELINSIGALKGEKIVLTNNPSEFASQILESLGIKTLFSRIIGMRERSFILKPNKKAFIVAQEAIKKGKSVAVLDDEIENIRVAKQLGCVTILVNSQKTTEYADCNIQLP